MGGGDLSHAGQTSLRADHPTNTLSYRSAQPALPVPECQATHVTRPQTRQLQQAHFSLGILSPKVSECYCFWGGKKFFGAFVTKPPLCGVARKREENNAGGAPPKFFLGKIPKHGRVGGQSHESQILC